MRRESIQTDLVSSGIPADLTQRDQWLPHRNKVPIDPATGDKARYTDPDVPVPFQPAVDYAQEHNLDGVGFVTYPDDPLSCIDGDKVRDPTSGEYYDWIKAATVQFNSYAEESLSGDIHIWVKGVKPGPKTGPVDHPCGGRVEIHSGPKFIVVTGKHIEGTPTAINDAQLPLTGLYFQVFGPTTQDACQNDQLPPATGLSDEQVIAKASTARNGAKFRRLFFEGDRTGYGSPSEADGALAMQIGFWTGGDVGQVERIMRKSGLVRPKWDRPGSKSYIRDEVIIPALLKLEETYEPDPDSMSQTSQSLIVAGTVGTPARRLQAVSFSGRDRPGPQTWAVRGLVPERHPTILYGEGGTAKSILAMHLGISIAAGFEKWLGFELSQTSQTYKGTGTVGTPVLYLDFELDEEDQARRAFDLSQSMGLREPPEGFLYMSAVGYGTDQAIREALKTCMDRGVKLLVLDSAGLAMEGDSEVAKDVLAFFRKYIEPLKAAGITVLIIDHQSKPQKGERYSDKWAFGSAYKTYNARSTIQVSASQDQNVVTATLWHRKVNFGPKQPPFGVKVVFGEGWIEVERLNDAVPEPEPETATDKILKALQSGPMYPAQIAEVTKLDPKTVRNRVSDLRGKRIENTGDRDGAAFEVRLKTEDPNPKATLDVLMGGRGDHDSEAA